MERLEVLHLLKEARKTIQAPVDLYGCDRLYDKEASGPIQRFQILVSLMLSSQTKDEVTAAAVARLKTIGLTPRIISEIEEDELANLLYPVGFYRVKAKALKQTALLLEDDIPQSYEELVKLPGVGPKMAHLCMRVAWGITTGIGVDTHVHRIANRLGWTNTRTPEQTRVELESWLPRDEWATVNELLVGWGQTICLPKRPLCHQCPLSSKCPSAFK